MANSRPTWDETWMAVAKQIAQRSLCDRDQVGAVVVSARNRIIDTGYNGPPAGWKRQLDGAEARHLGCEFWCTRGQTQTTFKREIQGQVYDILTGNTLAGDYSDCPALHAEANALMFSDRRLREGGTIYVSSGTCGGCAKLVANSGLVRAVYATTDRDISHRDSRRWYDFIETCGLEVSLV